MYKMKWKPHRRTDAHTSRFVFIGNKQYGSHVCRKVGYAYRAHERNAQKYKRVGGGAEVKRFFRSNIGDPVSRQQRA